VMKKRETPPLPFHSIPNIPEETFRNK